MIYPYMSKKKKKIMSSRHALHLIYFLL